MSTFSMRVSTLCAPKSRGGRWVAVVLALAVLAPAAVAMGPTGAEESSIKPAKDPSAVRIKKALKDVTSLEFVETPLRDVVDYLKDLHGIEIQLDDRALELVNVPTDAPITADLKTVSLGSALDLVLGKLDLTWVLHNEVLLITSIARANELTAVKVYDVKDLLGQDKQADGLALILQQSLSDKPSPGGPDGAPETAKLTPKVAPIAPFRHLLIVRANYPGHQALDELLSQLRLRLASEKEPAASVSH